MGIIDEQISLLLGPMEPIKFKSKARFQIQLRPVCTNQFYQSN